MDMNNENIEKIKTKLEKISQGLTLNGLDVEEIKSKISTAPKLITEKEFLDAGAKLVAKISLEGNDPDECSATVFLLSMFTAMLWNELSKN